ncbi:MAG: hypothetical protein JST54_26165 [Deltaproteobacteria bacterium]|nr:hypothetical protein [Deltaproteobacteria bacterium]
MSPRKPHDPSSKNHVAAGGQPNPFLESGPYDALGMLTPADLKQMRETAVPPAVPKNPPRNLVTAFTPEVKRILSHPGVRAFFGTRVDMAGLLESEGRFEIFDAIRTRADNTSALAAQISAPDGLRVQDQLGKLMSNWDDFEEAFPKEALVLAPLQQLWVTNHPGRKPAKATRSGKPGAEEGASAPGAGATVPSVVPASKVTPASTSSATASATPPPEIAAETRDVRPQA